MLTADYAILVIEPECLRDEKPRRQRISAHLAAECRIQQLPAHNVPVPLSSHARMPMRELRPIPQEMQQPAHRQALPGRFHVWLVVRKIGRASCRERVCQYV